MPDFDDRMQSSIVEQIVARLSVLASCTDEPGRITRLPLTPAHRAAILEIVDWMEQAGMTAGVDLAGNVVGRYEALVPDALALVIGSHCDTVRNAGAYDGTLGVVLAIEVVHQLNQRNLRLPFAIEVVAFGDEEGVRFGSSVLGSRFSAGLTAADDDARADAEGVTVRSALARFDVTALPGGGTARLSPAPLAYVEVHIEQGPVLERQQSALGCVTAINGQTRLAARLEGIAGHAGTVPMRQRRDALTGAAECLLAVERACAEGELVGTVGVLQVEHGAGNVIPGMVRWTVDVRGPDDRQRDKAVADIAVAFETIARARNLTLTVEFLSTARSTQFAPSVVDAFACAIEATTHQPVLHLPSGAGHDGIAMSALAPVGMIFVRCRNGISHHPDEHVDDADIQAAYAALETFVLGFDPPLHSPS